MTRSESPSAVAGTERQAALAVVLHRALDLLDRGPTFGRDSDLVQLVEVDALLRGAVLRIVRCPIYATATQDLSIAAAMEKLGPEALADAFRALAPDRSLRDPVSVEARCRLWLHGVSVAAAARWLSNQGEYDDPDEAYTAGLAHALCHAGTDYRAIEQMRGLRFGDRVESVARLGRFFGRAVHDGDLALDGERIDRETLRLFHVVSRADALVTALGYGADERAATIHGEEGEAAAVAEAVTLESAHAAGLLGLPPLPHDELVRDLSDRELRVVGGSSETWSLRPGPVLDLERLAASQGEMLTLRSHSSIPEILDRGLSMLHAGLDFDRIVVLEREHGRNGVARVRSVACRTRLPVQATRHLIEVPVPPGGTLARALESEHASRSNAGDGPSLEVLGVDGFAAAPLRAGSDSVFLVVADYFLTRRPPRPEAAAALAMAAAAFGLVLENAALHAEGKTLRALAEKDALTGINNRRNVLEILSREIDRARRYGKPLSIALIDVDHFKSWNDIHGHQVGDMVLQTVAQLISSCSREMDACGRYGGEEFLVVLPETSAEHAMLYAERLRQTIESHGSDLAELYKPAGLSVSIGVTQLLPRGDDWNQMIHRADTALYAAKEHGRNRVCVEAGMTPSRRAPPPKSLSVLDEI